MQTLYIEPLPVSRSACSLHLINSVGQRVKEEKKAARNPKTMFDSINNNTKIQPIEPAVAFSKALHESFSVID